MSETELEIQKEILVLLKELNKEKNKKEIPQADSGIDLLEMFTILLRRWWIILLVCLLTGAGSFFYLTSTYVPVYSASTAMYVNNTSLSIGITQLSISSSDLSSSTELIDIYGAILDTHLMLDEVGLELNKMGYSGYGYDNLHDSISYGSVNNTPVFKITVEDYNPQRGIDIANTISDVLSSKISMIIDGTSARIVDYAVVAAVLPNNIVRNTIYFVLGAFVLVSLLIILFDYFLNDLINDSRWLETYYGKYPLLGKVNDESKKNSHSSYYYYQSRKE